MLAWLLTVALLVPLQAQPGAPAREPSSPAAQELADLEFLLRRWGVTPDWPFVGRPEDGHPLGDSVRGNPCPEISWRLACFEQAFGCRAAGLPEWGTLQATARDLLERLDVVDRPAPGEHSHWHRWTAPGWLGIRALLHELAGDVAAAEALLFGPGERCWRTCCGSCLAESLYHLCRQRAELRDRCGDRAAAERWYLAALHWADVDPFGPAFGRDLSGTQRVVARLLALLRSRGDAEAADAVLGFAVRAEARAGAYGLETPWLPDDEAPATSAGPELRIVERFLGEPLDPWWEPPAERWALRNQVAAYLLVDEVRRTWRVLACRVPRTPAAFEGKEFLPNCLGDLDMLAGDDPALQPFLQPVTPADAGR